MHQNRIASLVAQLTPGQAAVRLLPAGAFRAADGSGRPADAPAWRVDAGIAAELIARHAARASQRVVDYEHQTLAAANNGQPAPAAGWIESLTWRDADAGQAGGLFAGIAWTEKAAAMLAAGEYRYISPVFAYDATGRVLDILHAGLTNNPGLDGLTDLAALSAVFTHNLPPDQETPDMKALLKALGLSETASEAEAIAAIATMKATAETHTAALAAVATPDPAKYAPADAVVSLQARVAELHAQIAQRETDELVAAGIADGRILPDLEAWARTLDKAALKGFLDKAKPIAALGGMQSNGRQADGKSAPQSTDADLAVCKALGLTPEQFAAGKINQES